MKNLSIVYTSKLSTRVPCDEYEEDGQYLVIKIDKTKIKHYEAKDIPDSQEGVLLD